MVKRGFAIYEWIFALELLRCDSQATVINQKFDLESIQDARFYRTRVKKYDAS